MLAPRNIVDVDLPDKTLCLTYDDGPGPASAAIGRFLHGHGVRATFFVVGKFAVEHPEVLDELHAQGHIIGNHTKNHPDLTTLLNVRRNSPIRMSNQAPCSLSFPAATRSATHGNVIRFLSEILTASNSQFL